VIYEFIGSFNFFLCFISGYSKINLSSTRMKVDFDDHPIKKISKKKKENILRYRDQFEKF
jgi:hypothetical protein